MKSIRIIKNMDGKYYAVVNGEEVIRYDEKSRPVYKEFTTIEECYAYIISEVLNYKIKFEVLM